MAITRSQQARQMLKTAGAVEQDGVLNYIKNSESVTVPKEFKARKNAPATKLAYITAAEAKMLKKKKPGTPHKGPKGIPSYDSFDADGGFTSGAAMSAAETGSRDARDRAEVRAAFAPKGFAPGAKTTQEQDLRSSFIAAGAGQRVNPGFFDSRNVISPIELARARQFAKTSPFAKKAMRRTRGGGLLGFLTSGGFFGNIIRGLGQRLGLGKRFDQPTYDMSQFNNLGLFGQVPEDFEDDPKISNISFTANDPNNLLNQNMIIPRSKPDTKGLLEVPGIELTPFQKDINQDSFEDDLPADVLDNLMAFEPGSKKDKRLKSLFKEKGLTEDLGIPFPAKKEKELQKLLQEDEEQTDFPKTQLMRAADGGMIGGGIMDAAGRQQYFLGKLVKKAKRAVKKIVKSPIGKLGLMGLATLPFGGPAAAFTKFKALSPGMKALVGGGLLSAAPLFLQEEEEQGEGLGTTGSVGGQIDPRAYTDPRSVLFPAFRMAEGGRIGLKNGEGIMKMAGYLDPMSEKNDMAMEMFGKKLKDLTESELELLDEEIDRLRSKFMADGGSTEKEPVAKKTMPLLDMGGQEMDLRAEGGFVPIGRMEKADDVPARLSKNEFVFTAEAVRNAGDGDVDKGAEVMYNMMKNLESGGDVSEESQGLEGARKMFQTSKRLEEVI